MELELTLQQLATLIENYAKTHTNGIVTKLVVDTWFNRYGKVREVEESK